MRIDIWPFHDTGWTLMQRATTGGFNLELTMLWRFVLPRKTYDHQQKDCYIDFLHVELKLMILFGTPSSQKQLHWIRFKACYSLLWLYCKPRKQENEEPFIYDFYSSFPFLQLLMCISFNSFEHNFFHQGPISKLFSSKITVETCHDRKCK